MNPDAPSFAPNNTVPKKPRASKKTNYTQENAETESLKVQLSYAKTHIADLESQIRQKEQSLRIYVEKIKQLESHSEQLIQSQYLSSKSSAFTIPPSMDCPCQTRAQLLKIHNDINSMMQRISMLENCQNVASVAREMSTGNKSNPASPPTRQVNPTECESLDNIRSACNSNDNDQNVDDTSSTGESINHQSPSSLDSNFIFEDSFQQPDNAPILNLN